MTRLIRRWKSLSARERSLALEALGCLFLARTILALFPFATALRIMKQRTAGKAAYTAIPQTADEIKRAVSRAARHVPFKAVCLQQAFAAFWMLRRRGLPATVQFGIRRQEGHVLVAHAWSMSGDIPITGAELAYQFVPIAVFTA